MLLRYKMPPKFKVIRMNLLIKIATLTWLCLMSIAPVLAGDSDEELRHEISFLAKKLLEKSGGDSVTIEQPAYMKPFIGICSDVSRRGVKLTCITPGANASKAGLKTGDLVTAINGIDMVTSSSRESEDAFYGITKTMKAGDKLVMKLIRKGEKQTITATVGDIGQPAYTLTVSKK